MQNYKSKFPNLFQFFGGYFHNIWPELYPSKKDEAPYLAVLSSYLKQEADKYIAIVAGELMELINLEIEESTLRRIVTKDLGANIYPPGIGMTYQEWLIDVHRILTEKVK